MTCLNADARTSAKQQGGTAPPSSPLGALARPLVRTFLAPTGQLGPCARSDHENHSGPRPPRAATRRGNLKVGGATSCDMPNRHEDQMVRALQLDGGSEFRTAFEQACQARQLQPFVLPPRSPKLNGGVERANRTHTERIYEGSTADPTVREWGLSFGAGKTCTTRCVPTRRWTTASGSVPRRPSPISSLRKGGVTEVPNEHTPLRAPVRIAKM